MTVEATSVSWALKASKLPKSLVMARARSPEGASPPWGMRFFQKIECSTWPERLKARAFSRPARREKSLWSRASASFSRDSLAFST